MVIVEGIRIRARSIPKRNLVLAWRNLTNKPFPRVKAFKLDDDDFDRIMCLRRCEEDEQRELEEWNTILTTKGTDACVFNGEEGIGVDFMILIRESHYHRIGKIIEHELLHIVRGDL